MAYDNNTFTTAFAGLNKPANQIASTQEITTPSFYENKKIARSKEILGGLHYVEYKGLLSRHDIYDGIMSSRVSLGMGVIVGKYDDDNPCWKLYILKTLPPDLDVDYYDDIDLYWEEQTGTSLTPNNVQTVADLATRDALTPTENDYVNVSDARFISNITAITQANPAVITVDDIGDIADGETLSIAGIVGMVEITDGDYKANNSAGATFELQTTGDVDVDSTGYTAYTSGGTVKLNIPYSLSFIYDGAQWLRIYGAGQVNPSEVAANTAARHSPGNDPSLLTSGGVLTADAIKAHMDDANKHREINDANASGDLTEMYSSTKILALVSAAETAAKDFTYSRPIIDSKLSDAAQGISRTFATIAARDAANDVKLGSQVVVDEDRSIYKFTGVIGQAGALYWDFLYVLDKPIQDADANWGALNDDRAVSQTAVENRIQAVVGAVKAVDEVVADIAARDALGAQDDGFNVWVVDASADGTVTSGWALYKYLTAAGPGYVKEAEQESLDLDLTPFIRTDSGAVDQILQADANGDFQPKDVNELYIDNVGDIVLTPSYLYSNYPTAKLGQIVESSFQKATLEQNEWSIIKKNPKSVLQQILDLSDTTLYDVTTQTLNVSEYIGADILKFKTVLPVLTITNATQADPVVATVNATTIIHLKNGDDITIADVLGMTQLNGNDYRVANIDYDANTFELTDPADDTDIDGTAFTAYSSGGTLTFTSGIYEPIIDKIVGIPPAWEAGFASYANEDVQINHYEEGVATSSQLVSNTNNNIIIKGSNGLREMVTLIRDNNINMLYLPYSQNIQEQNLSSGYIKESITPATYDFDLDKARVFDLTMTQNTDFNMPTIKKHSGLTFRAIIRGAFTPSFPSGDVIGDAFVNPSFIEITLSRDSEGTQSNIVKITTI